MQLLRPLTLGLLAVAPVPWIRPGAAAQQATTFPVNLQEQLNQWFYRASRAAPGDWGVAVADQRGHVLWGVNATTPMVPASTVKLFTTGFARTVLGGNARQVTRVLGTGFVDDSGTWIGAWTLELNGDPTLERPNRSGPMLRELAAQLAARGIRRLTGPLAVRSTYGDAEVWYPNAWHQRHRGRLFAPLVGPLTINENTVSFTISPASRIGAAPRLAATMPEGIEELVDIRARTVEGQRDHLVITALAGGRYRVAGSIGIHARSRVYTAPTNDPRAVLEASWAAALRHAGIEWLRSDALASAWSGAHALALAEVVSPPLDSIAYEVNARSVNLGAEALLQWAAGSTRAAAERLTEHVRRVTGNDYGVYLADGSGLSDQDRASPHTFVTYMARLQAMPEGRGFPLLFPANGTGTLRRLATGLPAPGVVRAKTGTLAHAATVAGYLGRQEGMLLVSVMYNGPRVTTAKQHQWQLFRVLGAQGVTIPAEETAQVLGGEPPR